ncbi:hypothetical protein [Mycetohabitans sp. B46]|uniref:hypothetical protein n=1 Tax=Mycetohabitans sp. B46 TaxID=2772536 RepID=UPI00307F8988
MTASGFKPAFRRVQQSGDFDCAFAVVAMIVHAALDKVRRVAIEWFDHPTHGRFRRDVGRR